MTPVAPLMSLMAVAIADASSRAAKLSCWVPSLPAISQRHGVAGARRRPV